MRVRTCATALAVGFIPFTPLAVMSPTVAAESDQPCEAGITKKIDDPSAARNLTQLGFPETWKIATGKGVRVAVVDSRRQLRQRASRRRRSRRAAHSSAVMPGRTISVTALRLRASLPLGAVDGSVLVGAAPDATIIPRAHVREGPGHRRARQGHPLGGRSEGRCHQRLGQHGPQRSGPASSCAPPSSTPSVPMRVIVASGGNQGELGAVDTEALPRGTAGRHRRRRDDEPTAPSTTGRSTARRTMSPHLAKTS